jgi:D-alanine-D-alanine ligase
VKKLRILVLVHKDLIPPPDLREYPDDRYQEWKTEYDVISTLRDAGHDVQPLGVQDDLAVIRQAIGDFQPQIAFNLLEEFHGNSLFDHHIASFLELMRQPYTGCNPRGLMLCHDKALCMKVLSYHRVRIPHFHVFPLGRKVRVPRQLKFPVLVKSMIEDGSYGIAQASIVNSEDKCRERVEYLHEQLGTPAIVEDYIEGREIYVCVLGNQRLMTCPLVELVFGSLREGAPRIATYRVKWDWKYQRKHGIDTIIAGDLQETLSDRIRKLARRIYRILGLSGYARIDFRVTPEGEIYFLETNPNPDIGFGEELSVAAEAAGMNYPQLLHKVIHLGLGYRAQGLSA